MENKDYEKLVGILIEKIDTQEGIINYYRKEVSDKEAKIAGLKTKIKEEE